MKSVVAVLLLATVVFARDPNPKQMERSFVTIARRTMSASVAIRTYDILSKPGDRVTVSKALAHGSGFFVSADGRILTNVHVIEGADRIVVILGDSTFLDAEVVGRDDWADLALLKVDAGRAMPVIPISEPGKIKLGQWAFAIGNPKGIASSSGRLSFTVGTVAGLGRDMTDRLESTGKFYGNMIEADLSIWPGSSGGPMLNSDGEVIGIVSAMAVRSKECRGPDSVAYAIPLEGHALRSLKAMLAGRPVRYSRIGLAIAELDPITRSRMHLLRQIKGVLVTEVPDGLPAAAAGIAAGDIIISFGGTPVKSTSELIRLVAVAKPGSITSVGLLRRGRGMTIKVVPTVR